MIGIPLPHSLSSLSLFTLFTLSLSPHNTTHFLSTHTTTQGVAVALSVGLGLRSIASVDGFVNADSGELIVRDVKATPALTGGSPLLQQVKRHCLGVGYACACLRTCRCCRQPVAVLLTSASFNCPHTCCSRVCMCPSCPCVCSFNSTGAAP